jgi:hypothetical protein
MNRILATFGMTIALLLSGAATAGADVVSDWNTIMAATVRTQPPHVQARFAAITQLAVFEAVNAITGDYNPYLGTIRASTGASAEAAVVAAAHTVLKNYFPGDAAALDAARAASLAVISNGGPKSAGITAGEAAAAAMIAARANDGSTPAEFYLPRSSDRGQWQPTPGCPASSGIGLHWRKVTPFGIESADQFRADPPPALDSARYARDYHEVRIFGDANSAERPRDRTEVAQFYGAVPPIPLWSDIARQIVMARGASLSETVRALALLTMAISDAAVASFETKYHYAFWRPETAIHRGILTVIDDTPQFSGTPSFRPLIVAPCFPSYGSNHAALSNAGREILERIHGRGRHRVTLSSPAVPGVVLRYNGRLKQITDDIDDARVYGGIHFRFDQEAGAEMGRRVGEYILKEHLGLKQGCTCGQSVEGR